MFGIRHKLCAAALLLGGALWLAPGQASAQSASDASLSPQQNEIHVDEALGAMIDKDLTFTDHEGNEVRLGDYFDGERPVLLTLNYYRCAMLCNVQLNALTNTFKELDWVAGDKYRIVTVSIDPREKSEIARKKRLNYLEALGRGKDVDWTFHTGDASNIRLLAGQLGITYAYDAEQDQYGHPPVIMFLSPEGKVVRYLYGLAYSPRDVKFALMDASEGKVGTTSEQIVLSCFQYDPTLGQYGPFAMGIMRLGAGAMVVFVGIPLFFVWRRERRRGRKLNTLEAQA